MKSVKKERKSVWRRALTPIAAAAVCYLAAGALIDRVILPEEEPGPEYFPRVNTVFESKSEGFVQRILKYERNRVWVELTLLPHAPGPPEHIHESFPEHFFVSEGTLSLMVDGEKRTVRSGESFKVTAGTRHKPFNETSSRVVIRGPLTDEYAIPQKFSVFLTQAYAYFDESASNAELPWVILQMSRFSPAYDSWLAGPPVTLQKALFFAVGPTARLFGYRAHYEKYKPKNQGGH